MSINQFHTRIHTWRCEMGTSPIGSVLNQTQAVKNAHDAPGLQSKRTLEMQFSPFGFYNFTRGGQTWRRNASQFRKRCRTIYTHCKMSELSYMLDFLGCLVYGPPSDVMDVWPFWFNRSMAAAGKTTRTRIKPTHMTSSSTVYTNYSLFLWSNEG